MTDTPRAVAIGGQAVGMSCLWHLARTGWTEALRLAQNEPTAGSTRHPAGKRRMGDMSMGAVRCQTVVNAAGHQAGRVGAMFGRKVPMRPATSPSASAGAAARATPFGIFALKALRAEKGYRARKADLSADDTLRQGGSNASSTGPRTSPARRR